MTGFSGDYPSFFRAFNYNNEEWQIPGVDIDKQGPEVMVMLERVHMGLGYKYTPGTDLSHMSPQRPHGHPGDMSLVLECPIIMDMPDDWQTACIGSLDCTVQGILEGKAKWKLQKFLHPHLQVR